MIAALVLAGFVVAYQAWRIHRLESALDESTRDRVRLALARNGIDYEQMRGVDRVASEKIESLRNGQPRPEKEPVPQPNGLGGNA